MKSEKQRKPPRLRYYADYRCGNCYYYDPSDTFCMRYKLKTGDLEVCDYFRDAWKYALSAREIKE
jgi:hypothetical protein